METRAPYALIGLFVVAVIAAGFGFVYWLHNSGGLTERTVYRIQFESGVSGLLKGAAVLFNGIRVGEVTNLTLVSDNARLVIATIAVDGGTPVRADTKASLDFQGLTGVPVITLDGGTKPFTATTQAPAGPPTLKADPNAGQSMTNAARETLQKLDTILGENAEAIRNTMSNLNTFAAALARNSDRVDTILAGLERLTGGSKPQNPAAIYELTAPTKFPGVEIDSKSQMTIALPSALIAFDTRKILVRPTPIEDPNLASAEWADNVPNLIQAKIIEAFENAGLAQKIMKGTDNINPVKQLTINIRKFQITTSSEPTVDIELSARILTEDGKIVDAKIFQGHAPVAELKAKVAAKAFDTAFESVATDLVVWASHLM